MYCALYTHQENPVEGTPYYELSQLWPHAACHDGINVLYRTCSDLETDYVTFDSFGEFEDQQDLLIAVGKFLFQDVRPALYGSLSQFSNLYRQPYFQLWCGNYETKEELEADHELVFGVGVDKRKTLEVLNKESREKLRAYFSG